MNHATKCTMPIVPGYSLLSSIGSGGMGHVYIAKDMRLSRQVAIKILAAPYFGDHKWEEAKIQAQINHINVVQIFDVVDCNDYVAVIMEYVEGVTLQRACALHNDNDELKLSWLLEIAMGMDAIHRRGIIHSDLSVTNIVVTSDNQIKIVDFGVAQQLSESGVALASHANCHYASPEQLIGKEIDFRSDLFSFGIIAYELMIGQHPFGEPASRRRNILASQFVSPEHLRTDLPAPLYSLFIHLLSEEPTFRPLSFEQVIVRLKYVLGTLNLTAQDNEKTVLIENETKKIGFFRHYRLVVGGVLLMFLSLFVAYMAFFYQHKSKVSYVVVDSPVGSYHSSFTHEQKVHIASTVEYAIYQYIINHPDLRLVSDAELNDSPQSIRQLAEDSGAGDILESELQCQKDRCVISIVHHTKGLQHESTNAWLITGKVSVPTQFNDGQALILTIENQLNTLFPYSEYKGNEFGEKKQDLQHYVSIFNDVKLRGKREPETWYALQRLIASAPKALSAYWLFRELSIDLYYLHNDTQYLTKFIETLDSAPSHYRESELGLTDRFLVFLAANKFEKARSALFTLSEKVRDDGVEAELKARLLFAEGDYANAAIEYEKAIKNRLSISLLHNLALTYYYLGEIPRAKAALQKNLSINADYYPSNQLFASLSLLTGELEQAIALFERFIEQQPNSQDYTDLSVAYMLKGDVSAGLKYAKLAVSLSPNNPVQKLNLADLLYFSGEKEMAKQHYTEILDMPLSLSNVDNLLVKAQAFLHMGNHNAAVTAINEAEKNAADNVEVLYIAALVYTQIGELVSAAVHVKDAMERGIDVVWFNIPWFRPLCTELWFVKKLAGLGTFSICNGVDI